jgi:DNA-binding protein H-NS
MSEVQNVTLENRIQKLEDEIKQLKTELSMAIEFYAEVYELINELNHILKTKQLEKHDLTELEGFSLLKYENQTTKSRSKIESMIDKCIDLIFKDYRTQEQT